MHASIVWGDKNNKVLMDSIQVVQNRAAKMVLDRAPHSSSTEALETKIIFRYSCPGINGDP